MKQIEETEEDKVESPVVRKNQNDRNHSQFYIEETKNDDHLFENTSYDHHSIEIKNTGGFNYHNNFARAK